MDMGLHGKGAIVTGGSRGIGRAIALGLAQEGANVAICARGQEALDKAEADLKKHGVKVYAAACDVAAPESLNEFLETAHDRLGQVDILVNNVSAFGRTDDEAGWQSIWDGDVMASVRASWKVVPWMSENEGGSIIHISSVAALEAGWRPPYAAAKAALVSHANTQAIALAPQKIRVNSIAPGSIEFPGGGWEHVKATNRPYYDTILSNIPWGRLGTPEEVADAVVFLASERAGWITGVCLRVDGGQYKANM